MGTVINKPLSDRQCINRLRRYVIQKGYDKDDTAWYGDISSSLSYTWVMFLKGTNEVQVSINRATGIITES